MCGFLHTLRDMRVTAGQVPVPGQVSTRANRTSKKVGHGYDRDAMQLSSVYAMTIYVMAKADRKVAVSDCQAVAGALCHDTESKPDQTGT